jgi:hypothetical protein
LIFEKSHSSTTAAHFASQTHPRLLPNRYVQLEESFRSAKGQSGLDEYQVRTWTSWRRWVIPFTLNEIRRLFDKLILTRTATEDTIWAWSLRRRNHQATARYHHYQRRSERQ